MDDLFAAYDLPPTSAARDGHGDMFRLIETVGEVVADTTLLASDALTENDCADSAPVQKCTADVGRLNPVCVRDASCATESDTPNGIPTSAPQNVEAAHRKATPRASLFGEATSLEAKSNLRTSPPRPNGASTRPELKLGFGTQTDRDPTPASSAEQLPFAAVDAHVTMKPAVSDPSAQQNDDPNRRNDHVDTDPSRLPAQRKMPWRPAGRRCSLDVEAEADQLAELIDGAPDGDEDPLTIVETIMRLDDVPLRQIVMRGPHALADRLRQGLPHRNTGQPREITKPDERARRTFYCLHRLKKQNPDDPLLPPIDVAENSSRLPSVRLDLEATSLKADVEQWGVISKQERGRETGDGRALDDYTRHKYARDVRSIYAAAVELELVDASCSVRTLGTPTIAERVFAFLETLYTPAVVASMVAALARVTIDLYGTVTGHAQAIDFLLAEAKRRFPDQALSDAAIARWEDLTSDPLKMSTILDAPKAMMARSAAPSLRPLDRFARASRAVAAQLKLDSVGLDAADAARLDFDEHFRRENGALEICLPDARERGRVRWEPCTPEAEELIKKWLELKDREGIDGSLLFPSENDSTVPQMPRVAMAGIYDDFNQVTSEYLTFDEIKTLRCYKALKKYPERLRAIAEAASYKDPRSLARRLGILLDRRRAEGTA